MASNQRYFTVVDAAEYMGITESALRARMKKGQVPFIKAGNCRRISIDVRDLDRWLGRGRQGPPPNKE